MTGLSTVLASATDTAALGRQLTVWPGQPHVWLLRGHVGAGKTTLVRGLLRSLGVGRSVTSPTFTLTKHYRLRGRPWRRVVHIDGYRLHDKSELAALELDDLVADEETLVLVEWPERLVGASWGPHGVVALRRWGNGRRATIRLRRR